MPSRCHGVASRIATRVPIVHVSGCEYSCLIEDGHLPLPEPEFCSASSKIESHVCIKCQAAMVLIRVNTARLADDVRTFECFNCDNVDKVMTETKRISPFARMPLL